MGAVGFEPTLTGLFRACRTVSVPKGTKFAPVPIYKSVGFRPGWLMPDLDRSIGFRREALSGFFDGISAF